MKLTISIVFLLCHLTTLGAVRNVRLVGHSDFITSLLQKTVERVEQLRWCSLKVSNITMDVNEDIFGSQYTGTINFENGFVISVQRVDIIQNTIQQMWPPNSEENSVEVRATLRLQNVAVGFDVTARIGNGAHRSTGVIIYPTMQFQFFIIRNLYTEAITTRVVGTATQHNNRMSILPHNENTRPVPALFNSNSIGSSVTHWGDTILAPIALNLTLHEIDFPTICYNCNA